MGPAFCVDHSSISSQYDGANLVICVPYNSRRLLSHVHPPLFKRVRDVSRTGPYCQLFIRVLFISMSTDAPHHRPEIYRCRRRNFLGIPLAKPPCVPSAIACGQTFREPGYLTPEFRVRNAGGRRFSLPEAMQRSGTWDVSRQRVRTCVSTTEFHNSSALPGE